MSNKYIQKNGRLYWYIRHVPLHLRDAVGKKVVKISLKTDNELDALNKANRLTEEIDHLWDEAVKAESLIDNKRFARLVSLAKLHGFAYRTAEEITKESIETILQRIKVAKAGGKLVANAVLGTDEEPHPKISQCLDLYWKLTRDEQAGKTPDELRKWKNPRIKALNNLAACLQDREINQLCRADVVLFRSWWFDKIEEEELTANSANKDFTHCRIVLSTVADAYYPHLNVRALFNHIRLKGDGGKRAPFTSEFIRDVLLNREKIKMGDELYLFLCVMAETGARVKEIIGLLPDDIKLDSPIPHILIRKNGIRGLKTKNSQRAIPLTGYALEALQKIPEGFTHYRERGDNLSNTINKYMRENNIYPTTEHSLYSLRHSFQDRLTAIECPERVQADLMGHSIARPRYGDGAGLEQKIEWMEKIKLKTANG